MNLSCPGCGLSGHLVLFASDADARRFSQLMGQVAPELADHVLRYLSLFAPAKHKLRWTTAKRLLEELLPDLQRRAIERRKRTWLAPAAVWIAAIDQMFEQREKLALPLKSHGYLYEIIAGSVERAEAAQENATEAERRQGNRGDSEARQVVGVVDEDLREKRIVMVCRYIAGRQQDDARLKRQPRPVPDLAHEYRADYGDVVVDAAIARMTRKEQA